jgi:predicted nucleic acid-binding protein
VIVADTNIVSTFARVGALKRLLELFAIDRLHITPATLHELNKAVEVGCAFLSRILEAIPAQGELQLLTLTESEIATADDLPSSLGAGESESIAVCRHRAGTRLLTNDKRARNVCREKSIPCLDLPGILRALWVQKVLPKKKVKLLLKKIETEQGMVIKNQEQIFE